eukprot:COSAG01_NODE_38370_length_490_cov_1.557545_1_plen_94_part_01
MCRQDRTQAVSQQDTRSGEPLLGGARVPPSGLHMVRLCRFCETQAAAKQSLQAAITKLEIQFAWYSHRCSSGLRTQLVATCVHYWRGAAKILVH